MDACMQCPYYEQCSADPAYPCFLDSPEEAEFWSSIGKSDG